MVSVSRHSVAGEGEYNHQLVCPSHPDKVPISKSDLGHLV